MSRRLLFAAGLSVALLALGAPALRADEGDPPAPPPGPDVRPLEEGEHDLEKLLKMMSEEIPRLMRDVEDRLFEADTGDFTQEEQRRIVEALRLEQATQVKLEELIHGLEHQSGT